MTSQESTFVDVSSCGSIPQHKQNTENEQQKESDVKLILIIKVITFNFWNLLKSIVLQHGYFLT